MRRVFAVLTFAGMMSLGLSATAQPPGKGGRSDSKQLEAELEKLKSLTKEVEATLAKVKKEESEKGKKGEYERGGKEKKEEFRGKREEFERGGREEFGRKREEFERGGKGMREEFGRKREEFERGGRGTKEESSKGSREKAEAPSPREKGFGSWGGMSGFRPPMAGWGRYSGSESTSSTTQITRQIDRLIFELEILKKEVAKLKK